MSKKTKKYITAVFLTVLIGWISIRTYYSHQIAQLEDSHNAQMKNLKRRWTEEQKKKHAEYQAELEAAWSGGMEAVLKDPELGIQKMLRKAAQVACPQASHIDVRVDNFTEFDIYISVRDILEKDKAASVIKTLVSQCRKYINSISFVYMNNVVKRIDKQAIDGISDWHTVDPLKVLELLVTP
jgi:hypothetical protein